MSDNRYWTVPWHEAPHADWVQLLLAPVVLVLDPRSRLFVGYLLSAFLLAWFHGRHHWTCWSSDFKTSQTTLDLQLLMISSWMKAALAPLALAWTSSCSIWLALSWSHYLSSGGHAAQAWSTLELNLLYGCVFFLLDDFSRYLLHRALHKFPLLYRFHQVHHSASVLSPLTFHRVHPIEVALYWWRHLIVATIINGAFLALFRGQFSQLQPLAYYAYILPFLIVGANLRHSSVWLSFGQTMERWFISPAQHQLHHSRERSEQQSNYGSVLAIWDRLASTLISAADRTRPQPGIDASLVNHRPTLASALFAPLFGTFEPRRPSPDVSRQKKRGPSGPRSLPHRSRPQTTSKVRT